MGIDIVTCPKCKMRVLPKNDGTCPSCQAFISSKERSFGQNPSDSHLPAQTKSRENSVSKDTVATKKSTINEKPNVQEISDYANDEYNLRRYAAAQRGWKRMWTGFFWLALGSCITWATYYVAASSTFGGSYTICYGAIALGAIYFLWGLVEWLANR